MTTIASWKYSPPSSRGWPSSPAHFSSANSFSSTQISSKRSERYSSFGIPCCAKYESIGPVYTSSEYSGRRPPSRALKKSTFRRIEMFGSSRSMFSKIRVYPRTGSACHSSPKYRSSVDVLHGSRISTDASSSSGYLSHCFFV